jgi:hypothetical protein
VPVSNINPVDGCDKLLAAAFLCTMQPVPLSVDGVKQPGSQLHRTFNVSGYSTSRILICNESIRVAGGCCLYYILTWLFSRDNYRFPEDPTDDAYPPLSVAALSQR